MTDRAAPAPWPRLWLGPAVTSALLLVLAALIGCGGAPATAGLHAERPGWVDAGERGGGALHAVGSVEFTSAADLRIATADARARAAIAAQLTTRMHAALDGPGLDGPRLNGAALDPTVREQARAVVDDLGLATIEITRRYYALDRNAQYSLARLTAADLDRQLAALDELPAPVRDALRLAGQRAMAP